MDFIKRLLARLWVAHLTKRTRITYATITPTTKFVAVIYILLRCSKSQHCHVMLIIDDNKTQHPLALLGDLSVITFLFSCIRFER